jgi:hypothetical protein
VSVQNLLPHELDDFVAEADRCAARSHSERDRFLSSRALVQEAPPHGPDGRADPFDPRHADWVLQRWQLVSGRPSYSLAMELDPNVSTGEDQLDRLYPFVSGDIGFIVHYMMGVYFVLELLADAPERVAVEYGVGWGHTSLALMQSGFRLTAVDIEPKWLRLLALRAERAGQAHKLECICGQFGDLPASGGPLGAVLFFESFHHALNHDQALARVVPKLAEGGIVLFAAEPIFDDFPLDWGLRQDGHALWAIRSYGWLELGFSTDYFIRLTRRHGLALASYRMPQAGAFGQVFKGIRRGAGVGFGHTMLSSSETGWHGPSDVPDFPFRYSNGNAVLELPTATPQVSVELGNFLSAPLSWRLEGAGGVLHAGELASGQVTEVALETRGAGPCLQVRLMSQAHRPVDLGMNDDLRTLGVAVGRLRFHA